MADRGIIFSAPMVRALLAGTKTQTRRLLNPQPETFPVDEVGTLCDVSCIHVEGEALPRIAMGSNGCGVITLQKVPHAIGDRLYVRESWSHTGQGVWRIETARMVGSSGVIFMADGAKPGAKYWPSIHMPREFSRLTLLVTDVRVQRLRDISEADAITEGIDEAATKHFGCPIKAYGALWDSLHGGESDHSWLANPWIYAVTFDVRQGNIDQLGAP